MERKGHQQQKKKKKERLPNSETEISRWKFVMVFSREPNGERSREVKRKREETELVESCLSVACKLEQSQILASYRTSNGQGR